MSQNSVGVIGYSEGNGHPYSFSAILNGYEPDKMNESSYSGIARYLSFRKPEEFGIGDWNVTHVWAPDQSMAANIAECTRIKHVVDDYRQMLDRVDVVLILRDDADSHRDLAAPFLENGIPVFIDKPLCENLEDLAWFRPWLERGKLMSCSGFRYYPGIVNQLNGTLSPGSILFSHSVSIINWFRYGIHVLEGITPILGSDIKWVQNTGEPGNHIVRIQYRNGQYAIIQVNTKLGFILRSSFYTGDKHHTINYDDNFSCFRGILQAFHEQVNTGKPAIPPQETETIIKTLIAAHQSLKNGGKKVKLSNLE